jgi:hypothetical protein
VESAAGGGGCRQGLPSWSFANSMEAIWVSSNRPSGVRSSIRSVARILKSEPSGMAGMITEPRPDISNASSTLKRSLIACGMSLALGIRLRDRSKSDLE